MAEMRTKAELPAKVGVASLMPEIPGRERVRNRETVIATSVTDLYKKLKDQVEVRRWFLSGVNTQVALTANWKKDAPTVLYGAGEAFIPSGYPITVESRQKATLLKENRTAVVRLVQQAVANDAKATTLERLGGKRFGNTAEKLRLKADAAYVKAKVAELGLKMNIQSLPHTDRAPFEKAYKFYKYLDVELEGAIKEAQEKGRDFTNEDVDTIITNLRREMHLIPEKQRFEVTADRTPSKSKFTVARQPNVILEAQAQQVVPEHTVSRRTRVVSYVLLTSELAGLGSGAIACSSRVPLETTPPGGQEIPTNPHAEPVTEAVATTEVSKWVGVTRPDGFTVADANKDAVVDKLTLLPGNISMVDFVTGQETGSAALASTPSGKGEYDLFLVWNTLGKSDALHLENYSANPAARVTNVDLINANSEKVGTLSVNTIVAEGSDVWATLLMEEKQEIGGASTQQTLELHVSGTSEEKQEFFTKLGATKIRAALNILLTPTPEVQSVAPLTSADLEKGNWNGHSFIQESDHFVSPDFPSMEFYKDGTAKLTIGSEEHWIALQAFNEDGGVIRAGLRDLENGNWSEPIGLTVTEVKDGKLNNDPHKIVILAGHEKEQLLWEEIFGSRNSLESPEDVRSEYEGTTFVYNSIQYETFKNANPVPKKWEFLNFSREINAQVGVYKLKPISKDPTLGFDGTLTVMRPMAVAVGDGSDAWFNVEFYKSTAENTWELHSKVIHAPIAFINPDGTFESLSSMMGLDYFQKINDKGFWTRETRGNMWNIVLEPEVKASQKWHGKTRLPDLETVAYVATNNQQRLQDDGFELPKLDTKITYTSRIPEVFRKLIFLF